MQVTSLGSSGFFDDDDALSARRPAPEEFKPPAWMQAPGDELPVRLLRDTVIARTDAAVLVLREVRVFSNGFEVVVEWFLRRRTDDPWEWQKLTESALHGGRVRTGRPQRETGLRFGLALPDGTKLRPVDVALAFAGAPCVAPADPPPPTVMQRFNGGGGSEHSCAGSTGIWVWSPDDSVPDARVPDASPIGAAADRGLLTFVTEWAQLDIPVTGVQLDGGEIADARAGVSPLWKSP